MYYSELWMCTFELGYNGIIVTEYIVLLQTSVAVNGVHGKSKGKIFHDKIQVCMHSTEC